MAEAVPVFKAPAPSIRKIELDRPWQWLTKGWADLWKSPTVSLAYGVVFAAVGYLLGLGFLLAGWLYLLLPLSSGFLILGPILAVGLYEISRRHATGEPVTLGDALGAWRRNASQIGLMGVVLLLFHFAWIRIAALIFMLYWGLEPPSWEDLIVSTFLTPEALPFLIIGTAIGAVLSALVFAISAVSIPMLLDRPRIDVITAIATSFRAVRENWQAMAFWAVLIVGFSAAGIATLFIGLVVTLPLIGHATWHAYKDLVDVPDAG